MERLQRLHGTQEQMLQQAALDLRVHKPNDILLPSLSGTSLEQPPAVKSAAASTLSPTAVLPAVLHGSLAAAGA